ncbi:branched-chain amino acid ABC transporter permease [Nocardiopsis sp. RSe5-2]|uniref:Branched-chain amino acid ABC transporter permease n=1 Tax=Nocardiopsis endophytica TaxID=3018445 RepID=A0ABT4U771_9ACTN|nr:branched-chain amino acid ABC transporter permease [Nocardiopsis endophytica]MDA2812285.1 branched-chain amino acid ABC transporter permease [Nocardiopsis endophytica]
MQHFADLTLNGLASGAVYAALALSLVLIYQATRVLNFAQPAFALVSAYLAYAVTAATGSYWAGFAAALAAGGLLGAGTERLLIRPLRNASPLSPIIATLGLLMVLQGAVGMVWGNEPLSFAYPLDYRGRFSPADAFALASVLLVALALFALYRFTPAGLRMRAAAIRPEAARLSGVRVGAVLAGAWALASAIGALAGMLAAPPFLTPNAFDAVFVFAIAAAVAGGLENPFGAVAGGLAVGVLLSYVTGYVGPELTALAALVVLLTVLALKPDGLFSRAAARKV